MKAEVGEVVKRKEKKSPLGYPRERECSNKWSEFLPASEREILKEMIAQGLISRLSVPTLIFFFSISVQFLTGQFLTVQIS